MTNRPLEILLLVTEFVDLIARYRKAVLGFVAPGAVVIGASVTPAGDGGSSITGAEWITAVVACIVTGAAVGVISNKQ